LSIILIKNNYIHNRKQLFFQVISVGRDRSGARLPLGRGLPLPPFWIPLTEPNQGQARW